MNFPEREAGFPWPPTSTTSSSMDERRAVIDVGTNSVKLLVADVVGRMVRPVLKSSKQTRLGHGAFRRKRLHPAAIARTVAAVADFARQAAQLQPACVRVLATSAAREATNGHKLVLAIQHASGLSAEIISGEQEANLVFQGVTSERSFGSTPLLIVDVGGGSTEWIVGEGGFLYFTASTRLGTTRLLEAHPISDPPTAKDLARCRQRVAKVVHRQVLPKLQPVLRSFCRREIRLAGLGGAIKSLARLGTAQVSAEGSEPLRLGLEHVRERVARLWRLSSQARRQLGGLDPEKADVALAGALIFETVMAEFGFSELFVSQRGLRDGALLTSPNPGPDSEARPPVLVPSQSGREAKGWDLAITPEYAPRPDVLPRV